MVLNKKHEAFTPPSIKNTSQIRRMHTYTVFSMCSIRHLISKIFTLVMSHSVKYLHYHQLGWIPLTHPDQINIQYFNVNHQRENTVWTCWGFVPGNIVQCKTSTHKNFYPEICYWCLPVQTKKKYNKASDQSLSSDMMDVVQLDWLHLCKKHVLAIGLRKISQKHSVLGLFTFKSILVKP